jgi:hypothetical protein
MTATRRPEIELAPDVGRGTTLAGVLSRTDATARLVERNDPSGGP